MKTSQLGEALYALKQEKGDTKAVAEQFLSYLSLHGYQKMLPGILASFAEIEKRKEEAEGNILTVKDEGDGRQYKKDVKEEVMVRIDKNLVGGYTLETEEKFTDHSYRGALLRIYQSLRK